ncbi:hypothetical protein JCM6882_004141 [Rhodosporidiobolus microsporus]
MLDTLPLELVREILSFAPTSSSSSELSTDALDEERRKTLCAVSLTCKKLREVARPLRFEVIKLDDWATLSGVKEHIGDSDKVRSLVLTAQAYLRPYVFSDSDEEDEGEEEDDETGADEQTCSLLSLKPFSYLHTLHLQSLSLDRMPSSLSNLVVLSLTYTFFDLDESTSNPGRTRLHTFLTSLPSLRAVACLSTGSFTSVPDDVMENVGGLPPRMKGLRAARAVDLLDILPQVEVLCCDIKVFECEGEDEARLIDFPRVLVDVHYQDEHRWPFHSHIKHIRFHGSTHGQAEKTSLSFSSLDHLLRNLLDLTALETLYLPPFLRNPHDFKEPLRSGLANIRTLCTANAVEVVFEPYERETFVSPHFWRKCKALKKAEEAGKSHGEKA